MRPPKPRVVLDLNVLISAYFFSKPDSPPRRVLELVLGDQILLLHSLEYLTDLLEALNKEKFKNRLAQINQTPESLVSYLAALGEAVTTQPVPLNVVRDVDDSVILACAVSGHADFIVSGPAAGIRYTGAEWAYFFPGQ